jgi:hypothetical protein
MKVPVAATVNVALLPEHATTEAGCVVIFAGLFTVRVTVLLVTPPGVQLDNTTLYWLLFIAAVTAFSVSEAVVAPLTSAQVVPPLVLTCHWKETPVPVAVTVNVVLAPAHTVALIGCPVIVDGVATVNIAPVDVTEEGQLLLTITLYRLLFIPDVTELSVKVAVVAPDIFV